MPDEKNVNAVNQVINTTQPVPLKGLILRGQKHPKTIRTVIKGVDGADDLYMIINEEDYDKTKHGVKVDKLPTKKNRKKEVSKKESKTSEK